MNATKPIRVLHVFAPSIHYRFGGPTIRWSRYFKLWNDPGFTHLSFEIDTLSLQSAVSGVYFDGNQSKQEMDIFSRSMWALKLLFGLFRQRKAINIIHFHVLWWGSLLAALEAKFLGIPTIYESVLMGADTPSAIATEKFGRLKLWFLRYFSKFLAISQPIKDDFLSHSFPEDSVVVIMNCVDGELFSPPESPVEKKALREAFGITTACKVLLFVGSISERKGLDVLLKSIIHLPDDHPELMLLVVGPKDTAENPSLSPEYTIQINDLINSLGDRVNIGFLGIVQNPQTLSDIYRSADIFVFPSRQEGLGNVVLEAMASGLPVITSDLPVLKNVIFPGKNGFVFPVGDCIALTQCLSSLLGNPSFCDELGRNARQFACMQHNFADWQLKITRLYHSLIT